MKNQIKNILENSFYQLICIYVLIVILITLGFLSKYALQFNIFAIVVGLLGAFSLKQEKSKQLNKKLHYILLIIGLILIFLIRVIPYFFTSVPLGYDPGIYRYGIEFGLENQDEWVLRGGMEPGFLYLMQNLNLIFSTDFILTYLFIFFCVLLGGAIYLLTKEYFKSKTTALIAIFIYAFSLIQFKTFWYLYYKNVIGMATMLFSIYFLKKFQNKPTKLNQILFILFGGLTGAIHRPTFYIFGLSYLFYAFISPYQNKKYNRDTLIQNIISGVLVLVIFLAFYFGKFFPAIVYILPGVAGGFIDPGQSPGTFINFSTYQYSILPYLALAVLGLVFSLRKKINILEIWAFLNLVIIVLQFFFFNRFIIMLDVVLIIFAAKGFSLIIQDKKKLGLIITIIVLSCMGILAFNEARDSKPLIDEIELQVIQSLSQTPENSWVMSTSSHYSPWIIGYSYRKTIAPGLFDYDIHKEKEWINFWITEDLQEIKSFLEAYKKPLYIFIGKRQKDNLAQFRDSGCFEIYIEKENNKIYEYLC